MSSCKCRIDSFWDYEHLRAYVPFSCKMPIYLCESLDRKLNKAKIEKERKEAYETRKKAKQRV